MFLRLDPTVEPTLDELYGQAEVLGKDYMHIARYLERARQAYWAADTAVALGELVQAADACIQVATPEAEALRLGIAWQLRRLAAALP